VDAPVITAGCGDFLANEIADRLGRRAVAFETLLDVAPPVARWTRVCAPSAAVALLAATENTAATTRLACGS
jgi:hypothetical protein